MPTAPLRLPGFWSRVMKRTRTTLNLPRLYRHWKSGNTNLEGAWPNRLYIEITNACNLDCIMCPTGLHMLGRPTGNMDEGLFRKIVDEMAPHVQQTTLHIWGEPLLHPRLIPMIHYAREAGIEVTISTNATLLDEQRARELLSSGLTEIYLCLDGMDAATYEAIRRKADFATTVANIERFIELKSRHGGAVPAPKTHVQLIEMAPTREQADAFRAHWSRPGVDHVNVKAFDSWGNQVKEINRLRAPGDGADRPDRWHCPLLWYHAHVYVDGTMTCCDRDFGAKYPLGNVAEKGSVMAVWNGEGMQNLRRKHLERDLKDVPPCRACTEWSWWKPGPFSAHGNAPGDR
jgi:radical SAM protein with 4Fe4S-binding SPASM domain